MELAHTLGVGGPEIEFLIIALALLVLGVIFFMQKAVKPVVSVVLVVAGFAMGVGAFAAGGSSDTDPEVVSTPAPSGEGMSVTIASPEDGATVPANEEVRIEIQLFGDASATEDGHFDVRVDGEVATMTPDPNPDVTFPPGEHTLEVEYVDARHESFDPRVTAEITVTAE